MMAAGQYALLGALLAASFASLASASKRHTLRWTGRRTIDAACGLAWLVTTAAIMILAVALLNRDFRFAYVAQYTNTTLPWHYAMSSLWVGQGGSLLLWAWLSLSIALIYRWTTFYRNEDLGPPTLAVLMGGASLLLGLVVFVADPCAPSLLVPTDGAGLSPSLQHPAMLIHPPIVFLGYALWAVPSSMALTAIAHRSGNRQWLRDARPWGLAAWLLLGAGIMLGGRWAYQELGWGGYWSWDPVENGSLLPWLIGTAAIHAWMVAARANQMNIAASVLTIATFGCCLFSSFLTRSGIFSSLHAFSSSSLGWVFLAWMSLISLFTIGALYRHRVPTPASRPRLSWFSRESILKVNIVVLVALSVAICGGTLSGVLSDYLLRHKVVLGIEYYNRLLIPVAFIVLSAMVAAPLLNWNAGPRRSQRIGLAVAGCLAFCVTLDQHIVGDWPLVVAAVDGLLLAMGVTFAVSLALDMNKSPQPILDRLIRLVTMQRRKYGGFIVHVGLLIAAAGIAASSLARQEDQRTLHVGQSCSWMGHTITLVDIQQTDEDHKRSIVSRLELVHNGVSVATLTPSQDYFLRQRQWTTEPSIYTSWHFDFYTLLQSFDEHEEAHLAMIYSPRVRWLWTGGFIMAFGATVAAWPVRRTSSTPVHEERRAVKQPHLFRHRNKQQELVVASHVGSSKGSFKH